MATSPTLSDGLDGLVTGCMSVTIAAMVGSLLGFLLWNWSPAKVFMGDVGSTFLGAVFAGLVLQASSWPEAFGYLLVATPLLGDACLCVPRRLLAGQRVFQAHRLHLFQRLHQAGWPHARVSLAYIAATAVFAVAMLAGGWPWVFGLAVVELLVGVWLDQRVAGPSRWRPRADATPLVDPRGRRPWPLGCLYSLEHRKGAHLRPEDRSAAGRQSRPAARALRPREAWR